MATVSTFHSLIPKPYSPRNCWMIDVPATLAPEGKRKRFFYASEAEALRGAGEIALAIARGASPVSQNKQTHIVILATTFLAEKKREVTTSTLRRLTWSTRLLSKKFGHLPAGDLTKSMVRSWWQALPLEKRGVYNAFTDCRSFYNWHMVQELCPTNPFVNGPKKKEKDARIDILTNEECVMLLQHPFPTWFHNWIVCGMFASMRPCESRRISHEQIDFEYESITIRKEDAKGGKACRPRSIRIRAAFTRHFIKGEGLICEGKGEWSFAQQWKVAANLLGLEVWPSNILRHTGASHMLEQSQNAVTTAFEMGHTNPRTVYEDYANAVTRRECEAFWMI